MNRTAPASLFSVLAGPSLAVFLGALTIGCPLPVLPQYVHGALGYGSVVVGVVVGAQSAATLLTRTFAGRTADRQGPRRAMLMGLAACSGAGAVYCVAAALQGEAALAVLLLGRLVLGFGESLLITGALAMRMGRIDRARSGMVMVWVGIALFAALGLGAPLGDAAYHAAGFAPLAAAVTLLPLAGLAVAWREPEAPALPRRALPLRTVLGWVLPAGAGLALSAVGYCAIVAFLPLMVIGRGWGGSGLVMSAFAGGFILVRLLFGSWPDRYGGRRVALGALAVECLGQVLIWQAPALTVAAAGAALTGAGYSLAFPSLGIEAVRQVPPENRGLALATWVAFLDVALGSGGPLLGLVVTHAGYPAAFAVGAAACAGALLTTFRMPATPSPAT